MMGGLPDGMTWLNWTYVADSFLAYPEECTDCVIGISGMEGDGKSVISRVMARRLYPKLIGKPLDLSECLFYGKQSLQDRANSTYKQILLHDEAIDNFSRTFYNKDQINFVKMMKTVREHYHIMFMNIPILWELDKGLRNRVRFYFWIEKRCNLAKKSQAIVYVFKQRPGAFILDPWNVRLNMKLDMAGKIHKSPNFYGAFTFEYFGDKEWFKEMEAEAKKIKELKRSEVFEDKKAGWDLDLKTTSYIVYKLYENDMLATSINKVAQVLDFDYDRLKDSKRRYPKWCKTYVPGLLGLSDTAKTTNNSSSTSDLNDNNDDNIDDIDDDTEYDDECGGKA